MVITVVVIVWWYQHGKGNCWHLRLKSLNGRLRLGWPTAQREGIILDNKKASLGGFGGLLGMAVYSMSFFVSLKGTLVISWRNILNF